MSEHLSQEILQAIYDGTLPLDQQMQALEHMSQCDYCANQFAALTMEHDLLKAPSNMKEAILAEANRLPVQLQTKTKLVSHRIQLLYYSLKVSTAVVCTLLLLGCIYYPVTAPKMPKANITQNFTEKSNSWVDSFNQFSTDLLHREDL